MKEAEAPTKPTPYEIMVAIASLPLEVERVETAGLEHDKFLYVLEEQLSV